MSQIKKPIITEKTIANAQNNNIYTFHVDIKADKVSAARELERLFDVTVEETKSNVRIGKVVRFGRTQGRRSHRKIMMFKLKQGNKIDVFNQ